MYFLKLLLGKVPRQEKADDTYWMQAHKLGETWYGVIVTLVWK